MCTSWSGSVSPLARDTAFSAALLSCDNFGIAFLQKLGLIDRRHDLWFSVVKSLGEINSLSLLSLPSLISMLVSTTSCSYYHCCFFFSLQYSVFIGAISLYLYLRSCCEKFLPECDLLSERTKKMTNLRWQGTKFCIQLHVFKMLSVPWTHA